MLKTYIYIERLVLHSQECNSPDFDLYLKDRPFVRTILSLLCVITLAFLCRFGKSKHDELSILAPIYQCCLVRYSTLQKLMKFYTGPKHLSDIMRASMASDQTKPVLLDKHLAALDRRVNILLKTVYECTRKNRFSSVVRDDGF